jgi:integrase
MSRYKFAELFDKEGDLSKRWYVGYYFTHPETNEFKLFQVWISSKLKTRKERRRKASEIIELINDKLRRGFNPYQQENISFTNLVTAVEAVVEIKCAGARPRTAITYRSYGRIFIKWLHAEGLNSLSVDGFNYQHCLKFSDYIKMKQGLSSRTHNNYIDCLRTLFSELENREYILKNHFKKIKHYPEGEQSIFAYSECELNLLKENIPHSDPRLWLVCQFVYYCAIRPAELVRLKIKYLDIENGKIIMPGEITKNKRQEVIAIPPQFIEELRKSDFSSQRPDDFLFSSKLLPGPFQVAPTRLAERFRREANKIGLKRRLYDLKHTAAGRSIKGGANIRDLQLHFRHSDIITTENYIKAFSSSTSREFLNTYPTI